MTGRRVRPWWIALAASLLLHAGLLGGLGWTVQQRDRAAEPPPIEARLLPGAPAAPARPLPVRPPAPTPARAPVHHATLPPPAPAVESVAEAEAPVAASAPDPKAAPAERVEEATAAAPAATGVTPLPLNPLPPRLDLRFQVRYGLATGEQTLLWVNEGERYTLTSVAEARGLAGVFYRGRFVQTSHGRITPRGLQPEAFWDQRGDTRSSARFDAAHGDLTFNPAKGPPRHFAYSGEAQDALSLFFQLALTAPPPDGKLTYTLFNGKKLRDYTYESRGEVLLETALGPLRTLHLTRVTDGDGRFEAWLAVDRHYLPVRVLKSDEKGNEMELRVQSIAP
ncbi:MAG TPA: DUF3108 domain-containing protein [Thiobacillus sp.]